MIFGPAVLIFCTASWAEFSSSTLALLLRLMFRLTYLGPFVPHHYKQQLIFCSKLHDGKGLGLGTLSVSYFILSILCIVQKSKEFLTSLLLLALSESLKGKFLLLVFTPFKEREFLSMHIEQSAEKGGERKVWLMSKCGQKCLIFILQLILEPFTPSSGTLCCLAPASRVQHCVRALSEGWYLSYGSVKWGIWLRVSV